MENNVIKNKSGKHIVCEQRIMLLNIFNKNVEAGKSKTASVNLCSKETGISKSTIWAIIKQKEVIGQVTSPSKKRNRSSFYEKLNDEQKERLSNIVYNFYRINEEPNLDKVFQVYIFN